MNAVRLDLRVMPRAPRTEVGAMRDGRLVVRVTAPPVDDAANRAVIELLADVLDAPRGSIRLVSGATARNKTVEISGLLLEDIQRRLAAART
jgi:hypothetical protein